MIEVNLHPSAEAKGRGRKGGLSGIEFEMPDFGGFSPVETFRSEPNRAIFLVAVVLVPLVVGLLWFRQSSRAGDLETRLEEARADSTRLADLRELSDSLTARREEIGDRVDLVQGLDDDRFVWPHLMDEIARALPQQAWLRGLKQQSELPDLELQVMGTASRPLVITEFVRNLEQSPFVGDVQIVGSNRQSSEGTSTQSFVLSVTYSPPPRSAVRRASVTGGGG
ncbi:MAG: PilN domain-containing protein [Gemmatimonadota bacterium]